MGFYSLTLVEQQGHIAANIVGRELEIFMYQLNITNYTAALKTLPADVWPVALVQYQNARPEDLGGLSDADHTTVANYQHRDHFRLLLRTERQQLAKSKSILAALVAQLPADSIATLVTQAKAAMQTA